MAHYTCRADWYGVCNHVSTDPTCNPSGGGGWGCAPPAAEQWWAHEAKPCHGVNSCCAASDYTKKHAPFPGCKED